MAFKFILIIVTLGIHLVFTHILSIGDINYDTIGQRVAHGMLAASLISTVVGTRLPGLGAVYLGQQLRFVAPVTVAASGESTISLGYEIKLPES